MTSPFASNPFDGSTGTRTTTIFKLSANGVTAVSALLDVGLALDDDRAAFDVVSSESFSANYDVTVNPLQDLSNAQSNIHAAPKQITVSGLLINSLDLPMVGSIGLPAIPGFSGAPGVRLDLARLKTLQAIADSREPVMVVTPRHSLAKASILSLESSWEPGDGESIRVSITLQEFRVVTPKSAVGALADVANSATGNNRVTDVGAQSSTTVTALPETVITPGTAPTL